MPPGLGHCPPLGETFFSHIDHSSISKGREFLLSDKHFGYSSQQNSVALFRLVDIAYTHLNQFIHKRFLRRSKLPVLFVGWKLFIRLPIPFSYCSAAYLSIIINCGYLEGESCSFLRDLLVSPIYCVWRNHS